MNKTILYRKHLSTLLMIVFFSPLLIKAMHFLSIHHEHHHIFHSDKSEVSKKHHKCPICTYEFVEIIDDENPQNIGKPEFFSDFYALYSHGACIILSLYSFYLRAPPVNS